MNNKWIIFDISRIKSISHDTTAVCYRHEEIWQFVQSRLVNSVTLLGGEELRPVQAGEQQSPSAVFYSTTVVGEEAHACTAVTPNNSVLALCMYLLLCGVLD